MTESRRHLIPLASGRRVAVLEYGAPDGAPLFFFHGWPAAGMQGAMLDADARALGIRVLSPDRPGIGGSDFHPGRRLSDWPPLLRELAAALGLARCHVLGVSGGGPYALACAWALPGLVEKAGVVCGAPPLAGMSDTRGLQPAYRVLLGLHSRSPALVQGLFHLLRPLARIPTPPWLVGLGARCVFPPSDVAALSDPDSGQLAATAMRECWRQSALGTFTDAQINAGPWGFALGEVRVPVRLWHGAEDRSFAPSLAEAVAREIPGCTFRLVPGVGHYSLPIRHAREILADLFSIRLQPAP
jgi:pimeloyl-ACP methyl ester carboxylesterase